MKVFISDFSNVLRDLGPTKTLQPNSVFFWLGGATIGTRKNWHWISLSTYGGSYQLEFYTKVLECRTPSNCVHRLP